jgi:hypothetical protein
MSPAVGKYALIALIVAIAVVFSIYSQVHWFVSLQNQVVIMRVLEGALSSVGISGIPFLVYWGVGRFRRQGWDECTAQPQ